MKLAFLAPKQEMMETIQSVVSEEFHQITVIPLLYEDYKLAAKLVDENQDKVDAVLFIGVAPYNYARKYCHQKVVWAYLDRYSESVYRALISAQLQGFNLAGISIDCCDLSLIHNIYSSIGVRIKETLLKRIDTDSLEIEEYNEEAYKFHAENYKKSKANACITVLYTVYTMLKKQGIPAFYSGPLKNAYKEAVRHIYGMYVARKHSLNNVVIVSIEMDLPGEYSEILHDEYQFYLLRTELDKMVYHFAEQVEGAVINYAYRNYLLVSTRDAMEAFTDSYRNLPILSDFGDRGVGTIFIGIGYGENVKDAKKNANYALKWAKKYDSSTAYICYSQEELRGPLQNHAKSMMREGLVMEKIKVAAEKANVSINTIEKLYSISVKSKIKFFTSRELAEKFGISVRSMNRYLESFENAGIVEVVGNKMFGTSGRPTRIFKIHLF